MLISPTPCAEREMLPDRDVKRLRDGYATAIDSTLRKELFRDKTVGQILWSALTSLLTPPAASVEKEQVQV